MGIYNPYAPQILGQEWVPIRNNSIQLTPIVNSIEIGHEFTLDQTRNITSGRFYITDFPDLVTLGPIGTLGCAIYPADYEDRSGPVRSVIIPVNNVGVTGTFSITGGGNLLSAVESPLDTDYFTLQILGINSNSHTAAFWFDVNRYANLLQGKRILGVDIFGLIGDDGVPSNRTKAIRCELRTGTSVPFLYSNNPNSIQPIIEGISGFNSTVVPKPYFRLRLGETYPYWNSPPNTADDPDKMNWRYADLQRFEISNLNGRHAFYFTVFDNADTLLQNIHFAYVAMEVFFCEEQRVAVGMRDFRGNSSFQKALMNKYTNTIPIRTPTNFSLVSLPPGRYTSIIWAPDTGDRIDQTTVFQRSLPPLNGLRELYAIPPHPGVQVNVPFPVDDTIVGKVFETVETHILPQISLHTSGGVLNEGHVYGRQAVAQVWGNVTAIQNIEDNVGANPAAPYPWVRFVARRFGETIIPLTLSSAISSSVSITPSEFDALPEIVDGWKEITLRFTNPPSMGQIVGNPSFTWSATGELAGNRWEILGANAPAISGVPGNIQVLAPQQLSSATYGQPVSGSAVQLSWINWNAPYVSGTTGDETSDAFLIFAQDVPPISGFTVTTLNQAVSGIGKDCGLNPCCIPTALLYNQLAWSADGLLDTFSNRTVANGWGTSESNQPWTITGAGAASDYSVSSGVASFLETSVNVNREVSATLPSGSTSGEITGDVTIPVVPTGAGNIVTWMAGRRTDANNLYFVFLSIPVGGGGALLQVCKTVAGVFTCIGSTVTLPGVHAAGDTWRIQFQFFSTTFKARAWRPIKDPQPAYLTFGTDASLSSGSLVSVGSRLDPGITNTLPVNITWDNVSFVPNGWGNYEIQRMDTVETNWETIMAAVNSGLFFFNDYEARVGITSSYRIRGVDVYGFPGPWSSTLSIAMPSPGASGGCISTGHILLFTSNERQNGSINLAYSSVWEEQRVEEDFEFPESQFVQLQLMYNKDFYTAFRPLERGGERFTRTVLVQAAAIPAENLADFRSLRDMAWDTVNYICVRDEDGNRWFATVLVPSGRVLRDRRLYMAPVEIIEVTDTPTPVNP